LFLNSCFVIINNIIIDKHSITKEDENNIIKGNLIIFFNLNCNKQFKYMK